jgi:hypothetical protein
MPQLRLLHILLCFSAAVVTLLLGALRSFGTVAPFDVPAMVGWIFIGVAAIAMLAGDALRTRVPAMEGPDESGWVAANRTRCVTLWAILEGGVALCAIALFLGANPWIAGSFAAGGLGFLSSQSPGTLAGH